MKRQKSSKESAAALLTVLILSAAIAIVVVSVFAVRSKDVRISGKDIQGTRAKLAEQAAFKSASDLLESYTQTDDYLVTSTVLSPDSSPTRYTFISQLSKTQITHTPLFSGATQYSNPIPAFADVERAELLSQAVAAPLVNLSPGDTVTPISTQALTHLSPDGSLIPENQRPPVGFVDLPVDPNSPFRTRYAFWIEDLEGLPNLDAIGLPANHVDTNGATFPNDPVRLGYSINDPRTIPASGDDAGGRLPLGNQPEIHFQFPKAHRNQPLTDQIVPGLSSREICLFPWSAPGLFSIEEHPFSILPHPSTQFRHRSDPVKDRENRFSEGLLPYNRVLRIPYGHGYADEGKIRHNVNTLIATRDLEIAAIIDRNLINFDTRKGGFPPEENYISTIAANTIDYADQDADPTTPVNSINPPDPLNFRGVDAYCPVNELFIQFLYVDSVSVEDTNLVKLNFQARVFVEFWNTSNQPTQPGNYTVDFHFLDDLQYMNQALKKGLGNEKPNWNTLRPTQIVENLPLSQGVIVKEDPNPANPHEIPPLEPNEIRVVDFGLISWTSEAEMHPSSILSPEIVSLKIGIEPSFRGGQTRYSNPEASYDLFRDGVLIDSQGRTPGWERGNIAVTSRHGFFFNTVGRINRQSAPMTLSRGTPIIRHSIGNRRIVSGSTRASHLGDPWMNFYSQSKIDNSSFQLRGYENHASPGYRNIGYQFLSNRSQGQRDLFADQTRVRDWPDRGYENALNRSNGGPFNGAPPSRQPASESDDLMSFYFETDPARAPFRLSQEGRFFSVTEFGHVYDPVMWSPVPPGTNLTAQSYTEFRDEGLKSLPLDSIPEPFWGGGNTLRIGRPEHELFDQPGMRASQLLDLFQVGVSGTNLTGEGVPSDLYNFFDPRDHQPPRSAPNASLAIQPPFNQVFSETEHAQGVSNRVYGKLNLNTVPTCFEIEALLRGPLTGSHLVIKEGTENDLAPVYESEVEREMIVKTLRPDSVPKIARGLYNARPFYSPSHLARVFTYLLDETDALPDHCNDAEAEESFARLFNLTTFSSRHFRVHTYAETFHVTTGIVEARESASYDLFMEPANDGSGDVDTRILTKRN